MASLEEEHLITAPHTSSGRIPTDLGYRVFVDYLAETQQLTLAQSTAIERFLGESDDFDDLLMRTVRTLAQLTNQVAVVQYPALGAVSVAHIELVLLGSHRIMSVLITDNGRVEQRLIDLESQASGRSAEIATVTETELVHLRNAVNAACNGKSLSEVAQILGAGLSVNGVGSEVQKAVFSALTDQVAANRHEKLILAGTANLVRTESDFSGSLYPVLDAIEEQVVVLKLLTRMTSDVEEVAVSIGQEHAHSGLDQTSVIAGGYASAGEVSHIGLLGPTRMDYPANIAAVRAVARYLSDLLDSRGT